MQDYNPKSLRLDDDWSKWPALAGELKDILLGKQRLATRLTIASKGLGAASFIAQMHVQHVTVLA